MTDLAARAAAIAAKARGSTRDKRAVMTECPCLTAWLRDWYEATGERATLLRATVDDREVYRA